MALSKRKFQHIHNTRHDLPGLVDFIYLGATFLDNQPTMNYSVKHKVFAGWCSSKSVGLRKVDGKNVGFINVKQQISKSNVFKHCRGPRQLVTDL